MAINGVTNGLGASPLSQKTVDKPLYTLDELIKRRALELGDSTLLGCPKHGACDFEDHSAAAVDKYADAAVDKLNKLELKPVVSKTSLLAHEQVLMAQDSAAQPPVIGILAQSGLHIIIQIIALNRLGYSSFLISTRLASPAITQLLKMAACNAILTTKEFHPVLQEVRKVRDLEILPLLFHSDYYKADAPRFVRHYDQGEESKKVAVIIHSSGSTGLPKPIYLTNASCIGAFSTNMDMRALITSPMFHSHGFYETFRSIYSGKPIYYCNYALPLTRESLLGMIDAVRPDLFHCVPYVLKLLAETHEGIRALTGVKLVLYGGSGCPEDLGNRLVENGVYLVGNYGATETGRLMNSTRPEGDKEWNYLRPLPQALPYVLMDKVAPGLFECVCLPGIPSKSTTNSDNPPGSFRTRDLFTPHPNRKHLWKYACRLDDRFTLVNGEKVLPLPIEGRIRQEEMAKEALVFGDGRTYPGILIVKADRSDHLSEEEFIESIWPAVEDANSRAESFSRIPRELVVALPAGTEYPRTDKGTFIRAAMYKHFEARIQAAYDRYEAESDQDDQDNKLSLRGVELESYLLARIKSQTGLKDLTILTDFFAAGIDSLQCIQMWSFIRRTIDLGGRQAELGQNVLYETENIEHLARHLEALRAGDGLAATNTLQEMERLITKYSTFTPHRGGALPEPEKDRVLLTGVTGALGAHVLAQLATRPTTATIWAMVRAPNDTAASERLHTSLESRGIALDAEKKSKVVPLSCNLGAPDLGLGEARFSELASTVTLIIHSAWAVNFNIPVQSFEDQHIKALWNLIQLSLSVQTPQPARFFFCSSVSAAGASPRPGLVEETYVGSPSYAQGTGYAQSKYVAEHITRNSMREYGARARVLRVGQLVGDTKLGEWNPMEGIPLMIQTARTLGALPVLDEMMTWLPVDHAALVVTELAEEGFHRENRHTLDPDLVYHVLNPVRFHWGEHMLPILAATGLSFEVLSTDEWMERMRKSDRSPTTNPPIKLLDWFEGKYGPKAKSSAESGSLEYVTEETRGASQALRNVPSLTALPYVSILVRRLEEKWA